MTFQESRSGLTPHGWAKVVIALEMMIPVWFLVAVLSELDFTRTMVGVFVVALLMAPISVFARCYECGKSALVFGQPEPRIGNFRLMAIGTWPERTCSECGADLTITKEESEP